MSSTQTARHHWLAITHLPKLGGATLRRLLIRFGSIENFLKASPEELATIPRLHPQTIAALPTLSLDQATNELASLTKAGVTLFTWHDDFYPSLLYHLPDPPPVLFGRGHLLPRDEFAVAIVGSRQVSARGLEMAYRLAKVFTAAGFTVVSGLAIGIDTAAHHGALATANGRTIAVLGGGLNQLYPRQNIPLSQQIIQHGAILSEQRLFVLPTASNLMIRNRIIAALSRAVIVVEASEKSGALETARRAKRLGRWVLACPDSPGTTALLQTGAEILDWNINKFDDLLLRLRQPLPQPKFWEQRNLFEVDVAVG